MTVAHQLILHPAVSGALKVGGTNVGRDKLYRTIQYFARFLSWYCLRKGYSNETVAKLNALKGTLGLSRKLMRIGKPMEHAQAAVKSLDVRDPFIKATTFGRQVGYAGYLFYDMLVWAEKTKVRPVTPVLAQKYNLRGARLWASGIAFSIACGLYKLVGLREKEAKALKAGQDEKEQVKALRSQAYAVKYQLVQDVLDILIPTSTLGYHHLDEGVIGLVGTVTSLMGLNSQIKKVL